MTSHGNEFRDFCAHERWFHAIDFGSVVSSGRFPPGTPQNRTLLGVMELLNSMEVRGSHILDIGASDGLLSFGLKSRGAGRVVATDSVDRVTFRRGAAQLGLDIEYLPRTQIKDLLSIFASESFDVILCAGVIYHMLNPLSAFIACRKLIKSGGYVLFESAIRVADEPTLMLNSESAQPAKEVNTYWVPSLQAMIGMTKLMSFDPVATRVLTQAGRPLRGTVLARAVSPSDVPDRTEMLDRIHQADFCDFEFRLSDIDNDAAPAVASLGEVAAERTIEMLSETIAFPFNPTDVSSSVGSTAWSSAERNF